MYDLFISYNWRDRESVERVAHLLRERGQRPFLDRWYLIPGRPWVDVLESTLDECRALAVFLGPHGLGQWQQREKELGLNRQTQDPTFPVIPVLLQGSDPAPGFLGMNTWVDLRGGILPEAIERLCRSIRGDTPGPELRERISSICPYRGLLPFREEDAPFFCGRESFTDKLVEAVEARSFVALVGASGSGKSSVVRAGLMPALRRQGSRSVARLIWDMVAMRPLEEPLESLANCLLPLLEPEMSEVDRLIEVDKLAASFQAGNNSDKRLRALVKRALEKQPGTDRLLLVVDQWEELYTLCRDDAVRKVFVDQLLDASAHSPLSVVATLRADFFSHALNDRALSDRLQDGVVNIGPMTRNEIHNAIVGPANKVSLRFEEGLDTRILDDIGDEPGRLPLLEFLLTQLWQRRQGGTLLHEAYDAIKGVQAIGTHAEEVFGKLSLSEQDAARWALVQLVVPGENAVDTRRRAAIDFLGAPGREVVSKLAAARLLVTARDNAGRDIVEIGHEALIRAWPRLRGWVDEDREYLRVLLRLDEEAAFWENEGRPDDLLLQARRRLAEADEMLKARPRTVSPLVRSYVETSLAAEQARREAAREAERQQLEQQALLARERAEAAEQKAAAHRRLAERTRIAAAVVSVLFILSVGAFAVAWVKYWEADEQRKLVLQEREIAREQGAAAQRNAELALGSVAGFAKRVLEHVATSQITSELARELLKFQAENIAKIEGIRNQPDRSKAYIDVLIAMSDTFVHLGATGDALELARTGKALTAELDDPIERQRYLYLMGFRIADALAAQRFLDQALAEYRAALEAAEFVLKHDPAGPIARRQVSFMTNKLGDILRAKGLYRASLTEYDRSLAIMREIAATNENDPAIQRDLAHAMVRVGDGRRILGDYEAALPLYESARAIYQKLVDSNPGNASLHINLATSISSIAIVHRALGNFEQAIEEFTSNLTISTTIAERDQTNTTWQHNLSFAYIFLGDTMLATGDRERALENYMQSLEIRERLRSKDPKNGIWQVALSENLRKIGEARLQGGDLKGAMAQYRSALAILEALPQLEGRARPDRQLFETLINIGQASILSEDPAAAREQFHAALKVAESIIQKDPNEPVWHIYMANAHRWIGDTHKAQKDVTAAIGYYRKAVNLSQRALELGDSNPERQISVADHRLALGDGYLAGGDRTRANGEYTIAIELLQNVTKNHPDNRIWRGKLEAARERARQLALAQ